MTCWKQKRKSAGFLKSYFSQGSLGRSDVHPILLISEAEAQGIVLSRAGLKLRWEADLQPPSALLERLRRHRSQLVGQVVSEEAKPAPFDFPRRLWPSIVAALSRFEADHEADACSVGWSETELWHAHHLKPWRRLDHLGAAMLTYNSSVVGIKGQAITLEGRTGNRLRIYRRAPIPPSSALLDIRKLVAVDSASTKTG